ncbi:MAG: hypothetical protein ABIK15_14255 [Pseudomonadota bacterium]
MNHVGQTNLRGFVLLMCFEKNEICAFVAGMNRQGQHHLLSNGYKKKFKIGATFSMRGCLNNQTLMQTG